MFDVFDQIPPDGISPEELEKLQEHIALIQEKGLILAEQYLTHWALTHDGSYETTLVDTDQPLGYDFATIEKTGKCHICVKSTEGSFDTPIHISYNELLQMREAKSYDLYRVYEVGDTSAKLRIARGMRAFAEATLTSLEQLPNGVSSGSVSVSPDILDFERPLNRHMVIEEE